MGSTVSRSSAPWNAAAAGVLVLVAFFYCRGKDRVLERLQGSLNDATQLLSRAESEEERRDEGLRRLVDESGGLAAVVATLRRRVAELRARVQRCGQRRDALLRRHVEKRDRARDALCQRQAEVAALQRSLEDARQQLAVSLEERERLLDAGAGQLEERTRQLEEAQRDGAARVEALSRQLRDAQTAAADAEERARSNDVQLADLKLELERALGQVDVVEEAKRRALAEADAAHRRRADELEAALEDALRRRRDAEEDGRAALERQRRDKDDQLEHLQHELERLGQDVARLTLENGRMLEELDGLRLQKRLEADELRRRLDEVVLERDRFQVDWNASEERLRRAGVDKLALERELDSVRQVVSDYGEQLQKLNEANGAQQAAIESYKLDEAQLQRQLQGARNELATMAEAHRAELERAHLDKSAQLELIGAELSAARTTLKRMEQDQERLQKEYQEEVEHRKDAAAVEEENRRAKKELERLEETHVANVLATMRQWNDRQEEFQLLKEQHERERLEQRRAFDEEVQLVQQRNRQVAEDLVEERKELERQKEAQWKELEQQQQHQLQLLLEQHQLEELERRRIFEQETQILEKERKEIAQLADQYKQEELVRKELFVKRTEELVKERKSMLESLLNRRSSSLTESLVESVKDGEDDDRVRPAANGHAHSNGHAPAEGDELNKKKKKRRRPLKPPTVVNGAKR